MRKPLAQGRVLLSSQKPRPGDNYTFMPLETEQSRAAGLFELTALSCPPNEFWTLRILTGSEYRDMGVFLETICTKLYEGIIVYPRDVPEREERKDPHKRQPIFPSRPCPSGPS